MRNPVTGLIFHKFHQSSPSSWAVIIACYTTTTIIVINAITITIGIVIDINIDTDSVTHIRDLLR